MLTRLFSQISTHPKRRTVAEVGERLGRDLSMSSFLLIMSSYYARVNIEEERFGVYADLLDLEEPADTSTTSTAVE